MKYSIGQRAKVFWLDGCNASKPEGEVTKVRDSFVEVTFDSEPGRGFDKVQKFTMRKGVEFVASGWHWVSGVPGLRATLKLCGAASCVRTSGWFGQFSIGTVAAYVHFSG